MPTANLPADGQPRGACRRAASGVPQDAIVPDRHHEASVVSQFALREAVGTRTLDELLGSKGQLDREIGSTVSARIDGLGIGVKSAGIKGLVLPGEMKEILNQVVQAERVAQANLIKRREETAATRLRLNMARLLDGNPILLRLKELETLEKVTEKIDKLTIYGGLKGVLKDVVRIKALES